MTRVHNALPSPQRQVSTKSQPNGKVKEAEEEVDSLLDPAKNPTADEVDFDGEFAKRTLEFKSLVRR